MPYALFCNEAKLSKAYPTEADVWKVARNSGLVVDVATGEEKANPHPVLDNDYEIRPCDPEPNEDPASNKAEAERDARTEPVQLIAVPPQSHPCRSDRDDPSPTASRSPAMPALTPASRRPCAGAAPGSRR